MKKLRLLLFEDCNRSCKGCCNKDWDLTSVEVEDNFEDYDLIMLTGGEPMLNIELVARTIYRIQNQTEAPIYLYTAKVDVLRDVFKVLPLLDGLTITLHEQKDVIPFIKFNEYLLEIGERLDYRLNVFKGVIVPPDIDVNMWKIIKKNIEWIKDAPLPTDEVFRRT